MARAYYNEFEPRTAAWLRELIADGHIAPGDVDERSINDVQPSDLDGYTQCHFFAGIGGWSYALRLAMWPDDRPVWTGSCPCQPFSAAGKRKGFDDERHLWPVFRSLIEKRRPAVVFGEQVAAAADWLGLVRGDLEALDYAMGAIPVQAACAGADHLRDRYWFVADAALPEGERQRSHGGEVLPLQTPEGCCGTGNGSATVADANESRTREEWQQRSREQRGPGGDQEACAGDVGVSDCDGGKPREQAAAGMGYGRPAGAASGFDWVIGADGKARRVKPGIRLLVDGFPSRVGLLRGFGNAIDPRPAAAFISAYCDVTDGAPEDPTKVRQSPSPPSTNAGAQ